MPTSETQLVGFPRSLLEQSDDDRLHYFEKLVVSHQLLKDTYDSLLHAIRHPASASLVLVFGPTGVGKTTLRQQIERQLIKDAVSNPNTNPGHIPVVGMEAVSPDSGNFNWRDYYIRGLMALDEPMIENKITYEVRGIHRDDQGRLIFERSITVPDLRRVLEKCIQNRQPRTFIVDEAQHFRKMPSGRRHIDQMDSLKSLASLTKTPHALIGTYDLLGLTKLSAQLSRRSIKIHFPRYRADNTEDYKEFKKLLRTFQKHLPLVEEPDLESHVDYFYDQCLGCIGMLKSWLYRTLAAALELKQPTITEELWKLHAEAPGTLVDMFIEISRGEDDFWQLKDEKQLDELHQRLRTPRNPNKQPDKKVQNKPNDQSPISSPRSDSTSGEETSSPTSKPPKGRKRRVGQQNPVRRPVGGEEHNVS